MNWIEEILFHIQRFFRKTPKQKNLDKILKNCTRIILKEPGKLPEGQFSGYVKEKTIRTITSKDEINTLSSFFKISEDISGCLMTLPVVTFVIVNSWGFRKRIHLLCGGNWIRINSWKEDAPLLLPEPLLIWLSKNGLKEPLDFWKYQIKMDKEAEKELNEWLEFAPKTFQDNIGEINHNPFNFGIDKLHSDLKTEFSNEKELILNMLSLSGTTKYYHNKGIPLYKLLPQEILMKYNIETISDSIISSTLDNEHQLGLILFFTSSAFQRKRKNDLTKIDSNIKETLYQFLKNKGDSEKAELLKSKIK